MQRNFIPTARFANFNNIEAALQYLETIDYEVVIKASGLAAGKGVVLPTSKEEARSAVIDMMKNNKFGSAGDQIVIEERLVGEEVSILAFCDGKTSICMPAAQVCVSFHAELTLDCLGS
jgi:phosphoribosylamine--glycine ligase / phosphoribosylformylglycinamidine cyclo-ligase